MRRIATRLVQTAGAMVALAAVTAPAAPHAALAADAAAPAAYAVSSAAPTTLPVDGTPLDGGGTRQLPQPPAAPDPAAGPGTSAPTVPAGGGARLPSTVFDAYRRAESSLAVSSPGCHLPWQLLAGIGQVESGHADGGRVDAAGTTWTPILGPVLDGNGFAAIRDTDGGRYDGSAAWDRAVGPMQFIPSTWAVWGADGNGDGVSNPNNVWDASLAAGRYLCAGGRDLADPAQLDRAVLGYNHSTEYLRTVRAWMVHFRAGASVVADALPRPATASPTPSPSPTAPAPTPTPSPGPTTGTGTGTSTGTGSTPVPSSTARPSASTSASPSPSPTQSPTPTPSPSPSGSPTACPSPVPSPSASPSAGPSTTASPSAAPTATASPTTASTPAPLAAVPGCPTPSPTPSPSTTATATASPTPSSTPQPR
ncbi:lytic transglycosylase domain-containing protein [Kitasatospora sp. NPDC048365]|uniref:lytic transglycosylase domain-containing protein n=1 Tax=Kitasatospora sp. NPDC048365 TaxID=3364050 RepID=UPI0037144CE3